LDYLVLCKLGNKVKSQDYKYNCENIGQAKEVLLTDINKQQGNK
jgi:hypothetical protein